jgi:transposase
LRTGVDRLTDPQDRKITAEFAADGYAEVEATWGIYKKTVAAYRYPSKPTRKQVLQEVGLYGAL